MTLVWPWPVLRQGQIWSVMRLREKGKTVHLAKRIVFYEMKVGLKWTPKNVNGQGHSVTLAQGH